MLVVAKKPRIRVTVEGQGTRKVIKLLKERYKDVEVKIKGDDESVDLMTTDWWKEMEKIATPGSGLKIYRENKGLTLVQLSEKCGIAQSHLSDMENNKRPIGKISAKKLAKALNCNYKLLL